jgi:hypothetical protein
MKIFNTTNYNTNISPTLPTFTTFPTLPTLPTLPTIKDSFITLPTYIHKLYKTI